MNTLIVYRAKSGQWAGRVQDEAGEELGGVAGCDTEEDVVDAAVAAGLAFVGVTVVDSADHS